MTGSSLRRIARTGVDVTALSLGTAPIGGLYSPVADDAALAVVERAYERGLRYFDTAPLYGYGTAETRLGTALHDLGDPPVVVSTKVGRLIGPSSDPGATRAGPFPGASAADASFDFSADGVRRSLEASLARLRLDRVDIVYLHDPDDHERQALEDAYPVLEEWRRAGYVGAIGVGMNRTRVLTRFVRETEIDVVLLAGRYTLLDQSAADELLPACSERGVSVVVGGVFNSGILADPRPGATYDYQLARPEIVARARRLAEVCARHETPLIAAAIQFPLGHPAVVSVLSGARSVEEVDANAAAFELPIPQDLWDELVAEGLLPNRDLTTPMTSWSPSLGIE